jgi:hypothetical protein
MRRTIETAPRDGNVIILEDDAKGTYDVAHWSPEAGEWVGENGEPTKITPSHWYPMLDSIFLPLEHYGSSKPSQVGPSPAAPARRYATPSIAAALVAVALIGTYFHAEVAVFVTRYAGQQDIFGGSTIGEQVGAQATQLPSHDSQKTDLSAAPQQVEADQASPQARAQEAAQVEPVTVASVPEARRSMEQEQGAEALANELAEARRTIDRLNLRLRVGAANSAQSLEQAREKTTALAQDAAAARQELTASTAQDRPAPEEERARGAALASELAKARREVEANVALLKKSGDDAAQIKQTAERTTAELQKERDRAEASSRELEIARGEIEANAALLNKAHDDVAQFKQIGESTAAELQQERESAKASSNELAIARREIETNVGLNKARDYAAQFKQTGEKTTAELQQERDRAEASSRELEIARREIEASAALLNKARDDAAQFKQTAERKTAELQKERDSAKALSGELAMARESAQRAIDTRTTLQRDASSQTAQVTQAAEAATSEQPAAEVSQSDPEAAKLMVRARALLGQGNIGAARIVLERAAETGSAQASFMLAETYDPVILSAWGTYGTRGEATKAREFYAKAHAGGIREAKDRLNALR